MAPRPTARCRRRRRTTDTTPRGALGTQSAVVRVRARHVTLTGRSATAQYGLRWPWRWEMPSFSAPGSDKWKTIGYTGPTSFADVFAAYEQFFARPDRHRGPGHPRLPRPPREALDVARDRRLAGPHAQGSINYYEAVSAVSGRIRRGADVRALLSGAWRRPLFPRECLRHQPSGARRSAGQSEPSPSSTSCNDGSRTTRFQGRLPPCRRRASPPCARDRGVSTRQSSITSAAMSPPAQSWANLRA